MLELVEVGPIKPSKKGKVWKHNWNIEEEVPISPEIEERCPNAPINYEAIQPDSFLPSQITGHFELTPEQQLYDGLLFQTLEDLKLSFKDPSPDAIIDREDIIAWFDGEDAKVKFADVTEHLNLNAQLTREWIKIAIKSWQETAGQYPDIKFHHISENNNTNVLVSIKKPKPVFAGRCVLLRQELEQNKIICEFCEKSFSKRGLEFHYKFCRAEAPLLIERD